MNINELKEFARLAQHEIDNGAVEDELRHILSVKLNSIFPENPWWIQAHVLGTEAYVKFSDDNDNSGFGFVDNIVGKTAIEYEKNLDNRSVFEEGYHQVEEYCAALCNMKVPTEEIYGVLSDTVRWYGYTIKLTGTKNSAGIYGANNIELILKDKIDLSIDTDEEAAKFELFVKTYLGREESRIPTAKSLAIDFGVESTFYTNNISFFTEVINNAMIERPKYAEMIKNVWQNFVAYLGASDYGQFSIDTYVNEYYLVTVAKLICANIINNKPLVSSEAELKSILNGKYFEQKNISNLVDYDYFGWLNEEPYVSGIILPAKNIQNLLLTYDFRIAGKEDLFGELLSQLANREHRLLLGQEFTPHWLAKRMVNQVLDKLDEQPYILDMCCGSGVFLVEGIKAVKEKYDITFESYSDEKDKIVFSCVTGFDIDPLAIMLAKVNWVLAMRDLFDLHQGAISIPVYHADSLFVATPITHEMPLTKDEAYVLRFNDNKLEFPAYLLSPEHKNTFDNVLLKSYKYAMLRARTAQEKLDETQVNTLADSAASEAHDSLSDDKRRLLRLTSYSLIMQLESLQRGGCNGIWYFILSNSYRPGMSRQQFNCIISNPPWLAMSKLANNPYRNALLKKVNMYGIKPPGASHLHMELATTFMLSSIDNYLKDDGKWIFVMPGSLLAGYNHEPFRSGKYRGVVDARVEEIWELPNSTFKNKAIIVSGSKNVESNPEKISGYSIDESNSINECVYTLNRQGNRSAWTNRGEDMDVFDLVNSNPMIFNQGADVFPRTALFHNFERKQNGTWSISPIENTDNLFYLINDSKKMICNELEADGIEDKYVFDCLISKHLSPFYVANASKTLIPGYKEQGIWKEISSAEIAVMSAGTSFVFNEIQDGTGETLKTLLFDKINYRGKLLAQDFSLGRWLVLSSAGGSNPCAAYIDLSSVDKSKLIIDQTLYWFIAQSEEEAIYLTGMLNSEALAKAIMDFQPQGEFGRRHIHTLPYKVIPRFNKDDAAHLYVVQKTIELIEEWNYKLSDEHVACYLNPNKGSLNSRRRKLRLVMNSLSRYQEYSLACAEVLGVNEVI